MKFHTLARSAAIVALIALGTSRAAEARNPHCAGGIQYVVQGMRDKDKGNLEDYQRQMGKAIQQLDQCANEDPADYEAIGYLGWAYAEVDSAGPAGAAFDKAVAGATAKGDKKKLELIENNRKSYWAKAFNEGVDKLRKANDAVVAGKGDTPPAEAVRLADEALAALTRANQLTPNEPGTMRNLGTAYSIKGDFATAMKVLAEGVKVAPSDTTLPQSLKLARQNYANQLANTGKTEEALAFFNDLAKQDPNNSDHWLSIATVTYESATKLEGDARKKEFVKAGDAYAKASDLKPGEYDLSFNTALAYQNATEWEKSVTYWRRASSIKPEDEQVYSSMAAGLAELKKCDEAVAASHKAVGLKPKDKNLHRQLGAIYTKCGNNAKATEELMIFLAMQNGKPVADPAAHAKGATGGSGAAKTLAAEGAPEEVIPWEADGSKYETWFYWGKKKAFTFNAGSVVTKSDWTAMAAPTGGKK